MFFLFLFSKECHASQVTPTGPYCIWIKSIHSRHSHPLKPPQRWQPVQQPWP